MSTKNTASLEVRDAVYNRFLLVSFANISTFLNLSVDRSISVHHTISALTATPFSFACNLLSHQPTMPISSRMPKRSVSFFSPRIKAIAYFHHSVPASRSGFHWDDSNDYPPLVYVQE